MARMRLTCYSGRLSVHMCSPVHSADAHACAACVPSRGEHSNRALCADFARRGGLLRYPQSFCTRATVRCQMRLHLTSTFVIHFLCSLKGTGEASSDAQCRTARAPTIRARQLRARRAMPIWVAVQPGARMEAPRKAVRSLPVCAADMLVGPVAVLRSIMGLSQPCSPLSRGLCVTSCDPPGADPDLHVPALQRGACADPVYVPCGMLGAGQAACSPCEVYSPVT